MAFGPWREPFWIEVLGFRLDFIEHQLAHAVRDPNGRAYNRTSYLPERRKMMQVWADYLDQLKASTEGFQQCYNAQVTVEGDHQLIVSTAVTGNASDQGQMIAQLDAVKATYEAQPETVLADADYGNERDLAELEARGIDGYVALGREGKKARKSGDCVKAPATWRMAKKLATEKGRASYGMRKWISEAPHGWIKEVLGFRRFSVRGLRKVQGEWDLVCLALNVKRLQSLMAT